jgi:formylglycine-generating enzyme required for sulfatase activity
MIGNPGNAADTTGFGSVGYHYNMGKYEISRDMIDKANIEGALAITTASYLGDKPAAGISWMEAAKFVNWLNAITGNAVAYKFNTSGALQLWRPTDAGYNASNLFRNNLSKYFLPSENEWYKAAFGNPSGGWYAYPGGSNTMPIPVASGTSPNTAVYNQPGNGNNGPTSVYNAGGLSAFGTMAQGGNITELMENGFDGVNDYTFEQRTIRDFPWYSYDPGFTSNTPEEWESSYRSYLLDPFAESNSIGFRVAMIPEPSSLSLLALSGVVVALGRRRK